MTRKIRNTVTVNGRLIVQNAMIDLIGDDLYFVQRDFSPHMAHDAHIQINAALPNNPLTRPGLRYNWPQESETK